MCHKGTQFWITVYCIAHSSCLSCRSRGRSPSPSCLTTTMTTTTNLTAFNVSQVYASLTKLYNEAKHMWYRYYNWSCPFSGDPLDLPPFSEDPRHSHRHHHRLPDLQPPPTGIGHPHHLQLLLQEDDFSNGIHQPDFTDASRHCRHGQNGLDVVVDEGGVVHHPFVPLDSNRQHQHHQLHGDHDSLFPGLNDYDSFTPFVPLEEKSDDGDGGAASSTSTGTRDPDEYKKYGSSLSLTPLNKGELQSCTIIINISKYNIVFFKANVAKRWAMSMYYLQYNI